VRCWGANRLGQLGDGTIVASLTAVATSMPMDMRFVALTSGESSSCARTATGLVYCWGDNTSGQMGERAAPYRTRPSAPSLQSANYLEVASGSRFHFARPALGSITSWGEGSSSQLGDGRTNTQYIPATTIGINN
jgi:alpha-tubulin suppressor-like RCC1 family protein